MPRQMRVRLFLAMVCVLAGCATSLTGRDRAELRVEGARITIVAPEGLCVDPRSLDVRRAGGFLLISDCALFAEVPRTVTQLNGVISVSISTGGLPQDFSALEEMLNGPGRAALGRSGQTSEVVILATRQRPDSLALKIRDRAVEPGVSAEFWRIFFPAGPRLVSAALTTFPGAAFPDEQALRLLDALAAATRQANPPVIGPALSEDDRAT